MIGPDILKDTEEKVQVIRKRLKAATKILCRFEEK